MAAAGTPSDGGKAQGAAKTAEAATWRPWAASRRDGERCFALGATHEHAPACEFLCGHLLAADVAVEGEHGVWEILHLAGRRCTGWKRPQIGDRMRFMGTVDEIKAAIEGLSLEGTEQSLRDGCMVGGRR